MCQAPAAGQSSGLLMASGLSALSLIFCRHAVMARQSWSSHPWMSKKDLQDCNNMATLGNVSNRGPLKSRLKAYLLRRLSFLPPPAGVAASRDHKCTGSLLLGKARHPLHRPKTDRPLWSVSGALPKGRTAGCGAALHSDVDTDSLWSTEAAHGFDLGARVDACLVETRR